MVQHTLSEMVPLLLGLSRSTSWCIGPGFRRAGLGQRPRDEDFGAFVSASPPSRVGVERRRRTRAPIRSWETDVLFTVGIRSVLRRARAGLKTNSVVKNEGVSSCTFAQV